MSTMTQPLNPKKLVVEVDSKPANQQNLHMFKSALFVDVHEWAVLAVALHDQKIPSALTVFSHLMYSLCCWA